MRICFLIGLCLLLNGCGTGYSDKPISNEKDSITSTLEATAMGNEQIWDDDAREELRDTLRYTILGELRLMNQEPSEILDTCREAFIQDECPETEWETFTRFAADELDRVASQIESEKQSWPEETDCDRLDRVEVALRERGIVLWQVSPCCDTCTGAEIPDRIDVLNRRYPGIRDRVRGYAFFIDQNMPEKLSDSTELSVYLGYGCVSQDDSEVNPEVYERNALAIAHEVCKCLRDEGFEVDWDGSFERKIGVSLNWQRRTLLK